MFTFKYLLLFYPKKTANLIMETVSTLIAYFIRLSFRKYFNEVGHDSHYLTIDLNY